MKMRRKPHAKEATCQDCGTVYIKNSSSQVRCAACSAIRKRKKHREQQARYRKQWCSDTAEAKGKKQTRQSDAKEAAERLAEHIRSADAVGLSYGMYMAKNQKPPVSGDGAGGSGEK